ncbi:hypothetical protein ACU8KH_01418 [Lachancea thermotolerans]
MLLGSDASPKAYIIYLGAWPSLVAPRPPPIMTLVTRKVQEEHCKHF